LKEISHFFLKTIIKTSDVFFGSGVLIDSNQNIYDGEFNSGLKSGIGKWHSSTGDQYIGDFKMDQFNGKAKR
jgi:hypothetical protein